MKEIFIRFQQYLATVLGDTRFYAGLVVVLAAIGITLTSQQQAAVLAIGLFLEHAIEAIFPKNSSQLTEEKK